MTFQQTQRGQLKIFLGYADGVGKTYAMLEAAHRRKSEGVDVVSAWVETHQQSETEALAHGLESIPGKMVDFGGTTLAEMDMDAVLKRAPRLAVVDDLAHRNAPGSRHLKRCQDVEELVDAGIDVYTTLNIQNLESLNDLVRQMGLIVEDTVPDGFLDIADELEVVDLPPEELIQRLSKGKANVSVGDTFVKKSNLSALREMALREAAERVDDQMRNSTEGESLKGAWQTRERVMVCISSHPLGERLVRAGRRLADSLNAEWFVVYVETPGHLRMKPEQRTRLLHTMRIAEDMGARAVMLSGESVPGTVIDFAQRQGITRLVIGRPVRPSWLDWLRGSLIDRIIRMSGGVDVFVINGEDEATPSVLRWRGHLSDPYWAFLAAAGIVALVTGLGFILRGVFEPTNQEMLFLVGVVITAMFWGIGPSALAAVLGTLSFALVFSRPPFAYPFVLTDTRHLVTLAGLLAAGLVISNLAGLLRVQVRAARRREINAAAMNGLSRDLTVAINLDEMLQAVVRNVSETFGREIAILLPEGERLAPKAMTEGLELGTAELELATWTYQHCQPSGRGSDTHSEARIRYMPLMTRSGVVGVMGVAPREEGHFLSPDQRDLLEGFASLAALAIERARLNQEASQAAVLQATERLQTALLNSISHDLRTPLATVSGTISSLMEAEVSGVALDRETRLDLLENATGEAERLNRLVGNLLDMTRLEAGAMKMKVKPCDVQDVIGAALTQASRRLGKRTVETRIPDDLPVVEMDFVLMVQVLVNLIDNAVKYSPDGTMLDVEACAQDERVLLRVSDRGYGIPAEDLERIFDKFYRVQRPGGAAGTGLGLSICRGIVEAHGGKIWARNRDGGGSIMTVEMPICAQPRSAGTGEEK